MKEFPHRLCRTTRISGQRGFALVVTMTLLVLLTVVAVGFLSLSAVTVRTSSQEQAITKAHANARMALMMAIGRLQEQLGPDQRVNATASSIPGQLEDRPVTPGRGHWLGVYDSWDSASDPVRPSPAFRGWLVSGPDDVASEEAAPTRSAAEEDVVLWQGIDEDGMDSVIVPKQEISSTGTGKVDGAYAWWIGDENSKALIDKMPEPLPGQQAYPLARAWSDQQSAPVAAYQHAPALEGIDRTSTELEKIVSSATLDLVTVEDDAARKTFHDFTIFSEGVLSDVARGGLKRDMSLFLDHPVSQPLAAGLPETGDGGPPPRLYNPKGITWEELWLYHNLWRALEAPDPKLQSLTGGNLTNSRILMTKPGLGEASLTAFRADPYSIYKLPTCVRLQWLLSLWAKANPRPNPDPDPAAPDTYNLYWVNDPILTLWNPYDVPLALHPDAYMTHKFWGIPYNLQLRRINPGGGTSLVTNTTMKKAISNEKENAHVYTAILGTAPKPFKGREGPSDPIVLMPGEVLLLSQDSGGAEPTIVKDISELGIGMSAGWNLAMGKAVKVNNTDFNANDVLTISLTPNKNLNFSNRMMSFSLNYGSVTISGATTSIREALSGRDIFASGDATDYPSVFPSFTTEFPKVAIMAKSGKYPFFLLSYQTKTEESHGSWSRFYEPRRTTDSFNSLDAQELAINNNEILFHTLSGYQDSKMPQLSLKHENRGLFGGSYFNPMRGVDTLIAFSVPREPLVSIAAFQHAIAMGNSSRWTGSNGLSSRGSGISQEISRAISNSYALPVLDPSDVDSSACVDHSYHANRMLWDSWFLSGILQRQAPHQSPKKTARQVYEDFVGEDAVPLANRRMRSLPGLDPDAAVEDLFEHDSLEPFEVASSKLMVHGAFNVNSTSVEAWKAILGSMEKASVPVVTGTNSPASTAILNTNAGVPVSSLLTAFGDGSGGESAAFDGAAVTSPGNPVQWRGNRRLTNDEIADLAKALVEEIRVRGPFLSMADFINRRPTSDSESRTESALRGPLQSALDSTVNKALLDAPGRRGTIPDNVVFPFPEAVTELPKSIIGPAHVLQADILTSIGSQLTARSDTFRIRAYGEIRDAAGKVAASAWCEAIVQRVPEYLDPIDPPEAADPPDVADPVPSSVPPLNSTVNKTFGRRLNVQSFRWLTPAEIQF